MILAVTNKAQKGRCIDLMQIWRLLISINWISAEKIESQTHFSKWQKQSSERSGRRSEICRLWRQRRVLFSRKARAEQVNLIKVGRFLINKNLLRNSKKKKLLGNTPLALLTGLKTTPFSDVTAGCATIFGHVYDFVLFFMSFRFIGRKVHRTAEVPFK